MKSKLVGSGWVGYPEIAERGRGERGREAGGGRAALPVEEGLLHNDVQFALY